MNSKKETTKRMRIVHSIIQPIRKHMRGVVLGGSLAYGANFSVTSDSDIDLEIILDKSKLEQVLLTPYFSDYVPALIKKRFISGRLDFIRVTRTINGVLANVYLINARSYQDFAGLAKKLTGFRFEHSRKFHFGYGFDGRKYQSSRHVTSFSGGVLVEKPSLVKGHFWGINPSIHLLIGGKFLFQKNHFLDKLSQKMWKTVIHQMQKEFGPTINLRKINVLNTYYTYQVSPQRIPRAIIEKVNKRTEKEWNSR